MRLRATLGLVAAVAVCLAYQARPAAPPAARSAGPISIPGPGALHGTGQVVPQSKVPVSLPLDVPAGIQGRVDERAAQLDVVVRELTREEGLAELPLVTVRAQLELTLRGLADGYLLESLNIHASPAWTVNRLRDVFPRDARPGLGAAGKATVGTGRHLVGSGPTSLVDSGAATGYTRGRIDDGTAIWELTPPQGRTIALGQRIDLTLLLEVHQDRKTATLHLTAKGQACTAVLGQCAYPVDLAGTERIVLRLRTTPTPSKPPAK